LGVFKGQGYAYVDHPGTPVEMLGTALLALTYPITKTSTDSFILYHLKHPELFLIIARGFLTVACIVCSILIVRYSLPLRDWIDVLASVALPALFFCVTPEGFQPLQVWSQNSFNFPFGTLILLGLMLLITRKEVVSYWHITILGFAVGILAAAQLYFVVWDIGIAVSFVSLNALEKRWKSVLTIPLILAVSSIGEFILATLPILGRYPQFFAYIESMIFHQGKYGAGPEGIISAQ